MHTGTIRDRKQKSTAWLVPFCIPPGRAAGLGD
jgi:hypothetical protein